MPMYRTRNSSPPSVTTIVSPSITSTTRAFVVSPTGCSPVGRLSGEGEVATVGRGVDRLVDEVGRGVAGSGLGLVAGPAQAIAYTAASAKSKIPRAAITG